MTSTPPQFLAALDLGSNSFNMVVARRTGANLRVIDRLREPVRLAGGIDADGRLTDDAQQRALGCLERFGQRIREFDPDMVRAVGTNTLRAARNGRQFQAKAERILGFPVEVISGQEEARLVYLGVSHTTDATTERRVVVDIGGGSTEVIVGDGFDVILGHSLYMGCVSYTVRFFDTGTMSQRRFSEAENAAARELLPIERGIRELSWKEAYGSSGTIRAVGAVLAAEGWTDGTITKKGLSTLRDALIETRSPDRVELKGLKADRVPVFAGGVAILTALFEQLGITEMKVASGALREGVLYDLIGRLDHEDVRERTITRFVTDFHVGTEQAARVECTAVAIVDRVFNDNEPKRTEGRQLLRWAARLHEIGLDIAYSGYHKHSAYVVANAHMPGFSSDDQAAIAAILRSHRRSIRADRFEGLPETRQTLIRRLTVLFRLAVIWHRGRQDAPPPEVHVSDDWNTVRLVVTRAWADQHPLTLTDLEVEADAVRGIGVELEAKIED